MGEAGISGMKSLGTQEGMESTVQIEELALDKSSDSNRLECRMYVHRFK